MRAKRPAVVLARPCRRRTSQDSPATTAKPTEAPIAGQRKLAARRWASVGEVAPAEDPEAGEHQPGPAERAGTPVPDSCVGVTTDQGVETDAPENGEAEGQGDQRTSEDGGADDRQAAQGGRRAGNQHQGRHHHAEGAQSLDRRLPPLESETQHAQGQDDHPDVARSPLVRERAEPVATRHGQAIEPLEDQLEDRMVRGGEHVVIPTRAPGLGDELQAGKEERRSQCRSGTAGQGQVDDRTT